MKMEENIPSKLFKENIKYKITKLNFRYIKK